MSLKIEANPKSDCHCKCSVCHLLTHLTSWTDAGLLRLPCSYKGWLFSKQKFFHVKSTISTLLQFAKEIISKPWNALELSKKMYSFQCNFYVHYELIRMCLPQSYLWCFSRTVDASADSHYKLLFPKISIGGERKKEYQAGVWGRSLFAKWDIFVIPVSLKKSFAW